MNDIKKYCQECGKEITHKGSKFCSHKCSFAFNRKQVKDADASELSSLNLSVINVETCGESYSVHGYGELIKLSRQVYLDQLDGRSKVHSSNMKSYLKDQYNLTEKEYLNIVIYGDKLYVRKCLNCGKELPFLGLNKCISRSYRSYCNAKCETEYRIKNGTYHFLSENRSSIEGMTKHDINAGIRGKQEFEKGIHKFQDVNNTILMSRNQFIKNFKINRGYTKAKLYWAMLSGESSYFKIGVTTSELSSRANHVRGDDMPYKSIHLIYEDEIDKIADLEYYTKLKFSEFRKAPSTEIFPISKFREILSYIKEIKV